MEDREFERFMERVYATIREIDRDVIPASWWDAVIKYYYDHGLSESRTTQTILETMRR